MKKTLHALMIFVAVLTACKKNDPEPELASTLTTSTPVKINDSTYTCGGNISDEGSAPVTERGVVVSLSPDPAVTDANDVKVQIGSGAGAFSDNLNPFYHGYTYHIRAYATNSVGVSYGADVMVTPGGGSGPGTGCNVLNVSGNITASTTWTADKIYVVEGVIKISSVLTIQPGTIVKLKNARLEVISSGKILANGTASQHIAFTSFADDSYCGDTNGDGAATVPQKGDWESIYLNGGTNNTFTYCDILYAGQNSGGYYNAVLISIAGPSFTFDHCTIAHTLSNSSSSSAYAFHGSSYMADPGVSIFTNNVFYDNDRPIYLNTYYSLNPNNRFHNPNNPSQKNTRNGIFMYHYSNPANATVSWNVSEVPYVMDVNFNGGGSGATGTVNIGNNVVVKFANSSAGIAKASSRTVNVGAGAVFTSYKDDTRGGDTNGDGSASSPASGDWDGFWNYVSGTYVSGSYMFYAAH
jgi:hypothetical protein